MVKILVMPSNIEQIEELNNKDIEGLILSVRDLSVNNSLYFNMDELKEIIKKINPKFKICISLNKIMHNKDLVMLEEVLKELEKMNIDKVLFYDLSVLNISKRLGLGIDTVIYQDHLNANYRTHDFYYKRGVKYSLVTSDITMDEMLEIKSNSKIGIMMMVYGYLPMFYSRRYLVSNYMEYIDKEYNKEICYLEDKDNYYPIVEEEYGTTIYTHSPINLINFKDKFKDMDYIILNSNYIDNIEFMKVLDSYLGKNIDSLDKYEGFINTKTIYRVKNNG